MKIEAFKNPVDGIKWLAKQLAEWDNAYADEIGNVQFKLQTKFRWGKYKDNQLRDVYKVDPGYIEWCLRTVNAFSVYEEDLLSLYQASAFNENDLNNFCKLESENLVIVDLSSYPRDNHGFIICPQIRESKYQLPTELIQFNREKISKGMNAGGYQSGLIDDLENPLRLSAKSKGVRVKLKVSL